jgi:hypothetical protein
MFSPDGKTASQPQLKHVANGADDLAAHPGGQAASGEVF